jgi:hypothetical protein
MLSRAGLLGPLHACISLLSSVHPSNAVDASVHSTGIPTAGTDRANRWEAAGIGGGGSFYEPSLSPIAKGEIFVTSDMSGLYHSRDDGEKFTMSYSATIDGGPGCRVQYTPVKDWLYLFRATIRLILLLAVFLKSLVWSRNRLVGAGTQSTKNIRVDCPHARETAELRGRL